MAVTVAIVLLGVCLAANVMANRKVCSLKPDSGPCEALVIQWYHVNGTCDVFNYGGCLGNRNNFDTKEECEQKCIVCNLPVVTGRCEAYMPSWYFNNGVCKKFVYGGCGGNGNRFKSRNACRRACTIKRQ
ncbi:kunitz-type serine protease inhibitor bitisilin-3-like [Dreissena polymorpha]|uniref:kunitz-type serine protease inhibitor bitisilin-3-like n=1 Tax=Dreissena polymorpha TaxID=45954 RepID=UPI00226482B0|nr:kunitz-type serine protease inhibitor bitisilin-3-like [Dreissena polymorpha]XP_052259216.1 kunitz-type serine protease inhibitor bitisilin-3-like [Dreissena polymorpha]XP_052259217.1 kunitz-type serine protease inhibitor bitisilin-3-like [Dreissena polymorpha]XP_052259218.1 kunitz-type serine protease inhibitor bitisilin-3-like [Dreissena polymorpha]